MKTLFKVLLATIGASVVAITPVHAAGQQGYTYTPVNGVHEVKYFHGCYEDTDLEKRPKIEVVMNGLSLADVTPETRPHETGKPSTEMVTFRLKDRDASLSVQFRSNDGAHCQQGVHSIAFRDVVLHNAAQLRARL